MPWGGGRGGPVAGSLGRSVVGRDLGHGDAVVGKERQCALPEAQHGRGDLAVVDLGLGEPGMVVEGGMDVAVAHLAGAVLSVPAGIGSAGGAGAIETAAVDLPATACGEAAKLLHIDVNPVPRPVAFVSADHLPGRPVHVIEPVQALAHQHPVDRRGRDTDPEEVFTLSLTHPARSQPLWAEQLGVGRLLVPSPA